MTTHQRTKKFCRCTRALPFSSTLLFLSAILPKSSYAQITGDTAPAASLAALPTTLQTSPIPSTTSIPSPTNTQHNSAATSSSLSPNGDQKDVFNYYFLIIAIVAALFCLLILYIGRRRKRKAALIRANSQRALAQDVAGFRARFGRPGPAWGSPYHAGTHRTRRNREEGVEGLDERGEAPPPYVPGSKPPSIRTGDGVTVQRPGSSRSVERRVSSVVEMDVELEDMRRPVYASTGPSAGAPPDYHEGPVAGITRPETAVTTNDRFGSTRMLLGGTERSIQA